MSGTAIYPECIIDVIPGRWSAEKANKWYEQQPWLVGCNFIPSTASNQLEMWQAETFDLQTIDKELGWAEGLGMNFIRVYLHDMLWKQDADGFMGRIDSFLEVAHKHNIAVMFVLLDSVHNPHPCLGSQLPPIPRRHNSRWVQSPHIDLLKEPARHDELKDYIQSVINRYKDDKRVLMWDLYNEPGYSMEANPLYEKYEPSNKRQLAQILTNKLFKWAREINPSQPLTVCSWMGNSDKKQYFDKWDQIVFANSDVISFHHYLDFKSLKHEVAKFRQFGRPLICTEYMARINNSTFYAALPLFTKYGIGACNWGLVAGKTQTQFNWDSWTKEYPDEPIFWLHDILRPDGKPYDENETEFIKMVCER